MEEDRIRCLCMPMGIAAADTGSGYGKWAWYGGWSTWRQSMKLMETVCRLVHDVRAVM